MTGATPPGAATASAPDPCPAGRLQPEAARARTEKLFRRHGRLVTGLCRGLLRNADEADDAAQQTFLSAHGAFLRGAEPRDPAAWLTTIARNECLGRIRERMRRPLPVAGADEAGRGPLAGPVRRSSAKTAASPGSEQTDTARANTYCMNRVNGALCHNRIPLTERYCDSCKKLKEKVK